MSEKPSFFYKEITNKGQPERVDLRNDFTNALLGDVKHFTLPQSRSSSKN